jgi:hypothetical protein
MCFKLMQDDLFSIKQRIFARLGFEEHHDSYRQESNIREGIK